MPNMTPEELSPKPTDSEQLEKWLVEHSSFLDETGDTVYREIEFDSFLIALAERDQRCLQQHLIDALAALPESLDFGDGYGGIDPVEAKQALTAALGPDNSKIEE